jgi:hypothetical protein
MTQMDQSAELGVTLRSLRLIGNALINTTTWI